MTYGVVANWSARSEPSDQLAKRAVTALRRLLTLDPVFSDWYTIREEENAFDRLDFDIARMREWIERGVSKDYDGTFTPVYGYRVSAFNTAEEIFSPRTFLFSLKGGSDVATLVNTVHISTGFEVIPDPSLITFALLSGALVALAEPFEASCGRAYPNAFAHLRKQYAHLPRLDIAWITYLAPRFAHLITPPPTAIVKRRPNGGLLMAATDETFNVDDPAHMAAAWDIQTALAPFNDLPYPQEDHV